jgi:hypothetical protein
MQGAFRIDMQTSASCLYTVYLIVPLVTERCQQYHCASATYSTD